MLTSVSRDKRVLVLIIAWGFGGFMEGMAGFGNIMDFNDLHDVFETKIYKNIINKSAIRKQKCREQCNVYHLCNGGCLNESILAGGIENIPEFSCTAFSIIISHIKTRMQEAISRGIEFENIYNKYIRNIIKKRLEMNENVK